MLAEVLEYVVVKLLSIVKNKNSRDSETANDAFLEEALDILLKDFASTHFMKQSIPIIRNLSCRTAIGKGLIMSSPY